jgi:ATP-dependent Clp protease adaptor protein ClpS
METKTVIKKKKKTKTIDIRSWNVVFYNDDKTPMEYVVMVLVKIFNYSTEKANTTMLKIHEEGKAVIGTYTFELAEQKAAETITSARNNGYPLKVEIEPN